MEEGPSRDDEGERFSWNEYFIGCSDLGRFVPTAPLSLGFSVDQNPNLVFELDDLKAGVLELECTHMQLQQFTLLTDTDENVRDLFQLFWNSNLENISTASLLHTFLKYELENNFVNQLKKTQHRRNFLFSYREEKIHTSSKSCIMLTNLFQISILNDKIRCICLTSGN